MNVFFLFFFYHVADQAATHPVWGPHARPFLPRGTPYAMNGSAATVCIIGPTHYRFHRDYPHAYMYARTSGTCGALIYLHYFPFFLFPIEASCVCILSHPSSWAVDAPASPYGQISIPYIIYLCTYTSFTGSIFELGTFIRQEKKKKANFILVLFFLTFARNG
ncbi:hypothetical protein F5Y11DRAFT_273761 [Daldinia sp. FL1419]|nr:hypothetical protein F5Y11DRAFT_273761 [Daldinia sp. FL1419]